MDTCKEQEQHMSLGTFAIQTDVTRNICFTASKITVYQFFLSVTDETSVDETAV